MIAPTFLLAMAVCLSLVSGRDFRLRATPSVSHSIVNLGKMEFNVYMNSKAAIPESLNNENEMIHEPKPLPSLRSESAECPCQQNRLKNRNLNVHSPPDMLSKILMNDDLFSFKDHRDMGSSALCCQSHEIEVFMEYGPKAPLPPPMRQNGPVFPRGAPILQNLAPIPVISMNKNIPKPMEYLPLIFDVLSSNKGPLQGLNPKDLEIFMVPHREPVTIAPPVKKTSQTPITPDIIDILAVGDKKTTMVYDILSANSSVKKDLKTEVGERLKDMDAMVDTDTKTTSAVQSNTL